jgi:hypothetical protein
MVEDLRTDLRKANTHMLHPFLNSNTTRCHYVTVKLAPTLRQLRLILNILEVKAEFLLISQSRPINRPLTMEESRPPCQAQTSPNPLPQVQANSILRLKYQLLITSN